MCAVAVNGKRIAYVGEEAGYQTFIGSQTRIVDLAGRMLLPAYVEAHADPLLGSAFTRGVDLQINTM